MAIIHYVSGSRADFGLMERTLLALRDIGGHAVGVVVTGQHTALLYGNTGADIAASGVPILHTIPVALSGADGGEMALAMAAELAGLTRLWQAQRPDLVLLLGDRGEMLAGALAAVHLGIPVGHISGGERSGTLDEGFRHAISKLAHYHFPATAAAAQRLVRMGEDPAAIHVIGAPGLVGLGLVGLGKPVAVRDPAWLRARFALPVDRPAALVLFHPVVQEAGSAAAQMRLVLEGLSAAGYAMLVLRPNSDAGGAAIDSVIDEWANAGRAAAIAHLPRGDFCRAMASADLLIGNSSAGIIESASFAIPCLNLGSRQHCRERNCNTRDVPDITRPALATALAEISRICVDGSNIYGAGDADLRLVAALAQIPIPASAPAKTNAY